MRRDPAALADRPFDVLVIGGGVHGAWAALDATQRGLRVAVIEKGDWCAGTSANSQRIVHGGLRYLRQGNLARVRRSIVERRTLLRIAPGLVRPLKFAVPTLGRGVRGRAALRAAMAVSDLVGLDRNRELPPASRIAPGRVLGAAEAARLFPWIDPRRLTGAAVFEDAQLAHPERLVLALIAQAVSEGAEAANYVRAVGLVRERGGVRGVRAVDEETGDGLEVRAGAVIVCAGPWLAGMPAEFGARSARPLCRASVLVTRPMPSDVAVAVPADGSGHLFVTPWGGASLIGTFYEPIAAGSDPMGMPDVERCIARFNSACPAAGLRAEDVLFVHTGLLPAARAGAVECAPRARIAGHDRGGGVISVEGVKLTTARRVAERAVDLAIMRRRGPAGPCRSARTRLAARFAGGDPRSLTPDRASAAARDEMARTLADFVLRRADVGYLGRPDAGLLDACAAAMGAELGWTEARVRREVLDVHAQYPHNQRHGWRP